MFEEDDDPLYITRKHGAPFHPPYFSLSQLCIVLMFLVAMVGLAWLWMNP